MIAAWTPGSQKETLPNPADFLIRIAANNGPHHHAASEIPKLLSEHALHLLRANFSSLKSYNAGIMQYCSFLISRFGLLSLGGYKKLLSLGSMTRSRMLVQRLVINPTCT